MLRSIGVAMAGTGSIGVATAQSSEGEHTGPPEGVNPVDPDEREPAHPDVTLYRVSNEIKQATKYWTLLTLPESSVYTHVSNSDDPNVDATAASDTIKTLRREYPVTQTSDDGDILIKPSKTARNNWGKNGRRHSAGNGRSAGGRGGVSAQSTGDRDPLTDAAKAFHNGLANAHSTGDVEAQWRKGQGGPGGANHHGQMTWFSAKEMAVSDEYEEAIREEAAQPDYDDIPAVPDMFEDSAAETFFQKIIHSSKHYYNPNLHVGTAHRRARHYTSQAKFLFKWSEPKPGLVKAAYASHYLTDLAQPLHTGIEVDQTQDFLEAKRNGEKSLHKKYADWARDEVWPEYKSNLNYGDAVDVSSMQSAAENLAADSHSRAYTCWQAVTSNPNHWDNNSQLRKVTENALKDAAGHGMGLYYHVQVN